jgi:hypothetical protein
MVCHHVDVEVQSATRGQIDNSALLLSSLIQLLAATRDKRKSNSLLPLHTIVLASH